MMHTILLIRTEKQAHPQAALHNGGYSFKMAAKKMVTRTFGGTLPIRVRARSDTKVTASNVNDFLLLVEAAS